MVQFRKDPKPAWKNYYRSDQIILGELAHQETSQLKVQGFKPKVDSQLCHFDNQKNKSELLQPANKNTKPGDSRRPS